MIIIIVNKYKGFPHSQNAKDITTIPARVVYDKIVKWYEYTSLTKDGKRIKGTWLHTKDCDEMLITESPEFLDKFFKIVDNSDPVPSEYMKP